MVDKASWRKWHSNRALKDIWVLLEKQTPYMAMLYVFILHVIFPLALVVLSPQPLSKIILCFLNNKS